MAITFNCPCGKVLSSRERDAGLRAVCPSCGRRVVVPGQRPPEPGSAEALRRATAKADRWIFTHTRQILIGTAVLALLAIGGVAVYTRTWRHLQTVSDPKDLKVEQPPTPAVSLDPSADPALWKSSVDSFAVAVRQAVTSQENLEAKFVGAEIRWEVTFAYVNERTQLYFLEAEELLEGDPAIMVWASLLPSAADKAERLKRGKRITIRGKIGPVSHRRSPQHPQGFDVVQPVECTIE